MTKQESKIYKTYNCVECKFNTKSKTDYTRHLLTKKHEMCANKSEVKVNQQYSCACGKQYLYRNGLWKHKKKCNADEVKEKEKDEEEQKKKEEEEEKQKLKQQNENNTEMILFIMEQLKYCQETNRNIMNFLLTNNKY